MKSGSRQGDSFVVAHVHMKSLREYGFPSYEAYTDEEKSVYSPGTSWSILEPGQKRRRKSYHIRCT